MLLSVTFRLFNINRLRHSSTNREFFSSLKKSYHSTKLDMFMASTCRKCFVFEKDDSKKLLIQFVYDIPTKNIRRQCSLLRSMDESVEQTINRLKKNIEHVLEKEDTLAKRRQKQKNDPRSQVKEKTPVHIQLLDDDQNPIDLDGTNQQVWPSCRILSINQQFYRIEYNAPAVIKFRFPDIILTNTIVTAIADIDHGQWECSIFDWYVTDGLECEKDPSHSGTIEWEHYHRGHICTFSDEHANKFVRLVCLPRNISLREGMQAEFTAKNRIVSCPTGLPMTTRHELTQDYFPRDSKSIRLVSYNILANGYASSTGAAETIYPYCPKEFLHRDYRKGLLMREILGYHADIICLQECDTNFYQRELRLVLERHGYSADMKVKSDSVREGEAVFCRMDRFTVLDNYSIRLAEYLRDAKHLEDIRHRFSLVSEVYADLLTRNTVIQILALESREHADETYLICNTHLYFRPDADVVRCLQVIIAIERIIEIKRIYEHQNKNVSIVWAGDFNANITSLAYHLLSKGVLLTDANHRSYNQDYATIIQNFHYKSPVKFDTYSNLTYTNYMLNYNDVIDHIFYEADKFQFVRSIPMPSHEQVKKYTALPSCEIPSDHLAVVLELEKLL